jgi:hypothetical protein
MRAPILVAGLVLTLGLAAAAWQTGTSLQAPAGLPPAPNEPAQQTAPFSRPAQARDPVSETHSLSWIAEAAGIQIVAFSNGARFDVPDGAKQLVVEARWNCALDCPLQATYGTEADSVTKELTSPATITVDEPEAGTWRIFFHSATASVLAEGEVTFTATF